MNTPVTIITTGRVTADLELKTSQNGRNTKFVQFSLAVNKGYGENNRPNYYKCLLFGEEAQRIICLLYTSNLPPYDDTGKTEIQYG